MLETEFETDDGAVRLIDFMPRRAEGPPRLMRIVEGLRGRVPMRMDVIRVAFELRGERRGERWRVALVHERRVVWRGRARTRSGSARLRVRRSIPDCDGADQVGVRASGPRGNTCEATAVIRE